MNWRPGTFADPDLLPITDAYHLLYCLILDLGSGEIELRGVYCTGKKALIEAQGRSQTVAPNGEKNTSDVFLNPVLNLAHNKN